MRPRAFRQLSLIGSVKSDCVQLMSERTLLRRGKQDALTVAIEADNTVHCPIYSRQLLLELSIPAVEVNMPESIALARPEELIAAGQKLRPISDIDPKWILLMENHVRFSCRNISKEEIKPVLNPIELQCRNVFAIGEPCDARE